MVREDSPDDEAGGVTSKQTVSREPAYPGNSTTSSAKYITDRNLLSENLSFKLRRRQSQGNGKGQGLQTSPDTLCRQSSWTGPSQKTNHIEIKDDRLKGEKPEMFPAVGGSTNQTQASASPSIPGAPVIDWDALSDVLPCDTTSQRAAMNAVQFKNVGGIFVHRDKYAAGRFTKHCSYSPTPSGETILITPDGSNLRPSRNTGSRSTRHVAWASSGSDEPEGPGKEEHVRKSCVVTPASQGFRSESSCISRPRFISKKNKVEHVNIKWKMSEAEEKKCAEKQKRLGRLSKNILPVTIGVDFRGQSVSKTKWLVPTLPPHDPTHVWFKCLNFVKQNTTVW